MEPWIIHHHSIPLASIAIRDLVFFAPAHDVEEYYQFFQHFLIPGSLRALGITAWYRQDVPKLGRFLQSSVTQGLRSLSVSLAMEYVGPGACAVQRRL